ncbi:MAG: hypothetical protein JRN68_06005 [Nitrososphaerota archaeon]|nr:hypothetical protein [Nitrososphaerota archaeon]
MGSAQERATKYACPVCNSQLERDGYIQANEALKKRFHEEFLKDEEEFERKLKKAVEMYHRQVEELRVAHARSQLDLKKQMMSAHQKEIVELTKYHDAILEDSHRQFHAAVRQNVNTAGSPVDSPNPSAVVMQPGMANRLTATISSNLRGIKARFQGLTQRQSKTEV